MWKENFNFISKNICEKRNSIIQNNAVTVKVKLDK